MDKDLQNTLKYKLADSKYGRSLSRSLKDLKDLLPVDIKSKQDEIHRLYLLEKKERDAKNKKSQDNDILQSAAGRVKRTYRKKISKKKSKVIKRVSKKRVSKKRVSKKRVSKKRMSKKRMSSKKPSRKLKMYVYI